MGGLLSALHGLLVIVSVQGYNALPNTETKRAAMKADQSGRGTKVEQVAHRRKNIETGR
jgi:hypothetical protein